MATTCATNLRTDFMQDVIDRAGANAKLKIYSGSMPASGGTPVGTLLATLIGGTTIGSAVNGELLWDEASFTQTNSSHVSGTPGFVRLTTSADVFVMDTDNSVVTGSITPGVNVTFNSSTTVAGNV